MRSIIILLFVLVSSISVFSQDEKEWTLYKSIQGVNIYYQETNCVTDDAPSQIAFIIKVVNTTASRLSVSWDLAVWYNYERLTKNVEEGENHYVVELSANETLVGDCKVPYGALYIFKDFITYVSPTKLTRFELENIQIAKI